MPLTKAKIAKRMQTNPTGNRDLMPETNPNPPRFIPPISNSAANVEEDRDMGRVRPIEKTLAYRVNVLENSGAFRHTMERIDAMLGRYHDLSYRVSKLATRIDELEKQVTGKVPA